jgi:hypothetical protein
MDHTLQPVLPADSSSPGEWSSPQFFSSPYFIKLNLSF